MEELSDHVRVQVVALQPARRLSAPLSSDPGREPGHVVRGPGNPTNFTHIWRRCPWSATCPSFSACEDLRAIGQTYVPVPDDQELPILIQVKATDASGWTVARSTQTARVGAAPGAPANTSPPTISVTPTVGQTLTASPGTWAGNEPMSFTSKWLRCDQSGADCADDSFPGSQLVQPTIVLGPRTVGATYRVAVKATNASGWTVAVSPPTAPVSALPGERAHHLGNGGSRADAHC